MKKDKLRAIKKSLFENPDVNYVGYGFKVVGGQQKKEKCVVVGVKKKKPRSYVRQDRMIPLAVMGERTDVQERDIKALPITDIDFADPMGLVQRMRPCPPGFSIGHVKITAGTLGAWVKKAGSDDYVVLSNNHVLANSNDAQPNDMIIQPGKADGGFSPNDHFAWLDEFVTVNFDGNDGKKKIAKFLWAAWKAPANGLAKLVGCPYRLKLGKQAIEQPNPNLVDAALARPVSQGHVRLDYPFDIGELKGTKNLQLGERVQKAGRTTEHTVGTVTGVDVMTRVQYGVGIATFDDQLEIRSDAGEFSAGGDSGSAILTMDGYIGGLLFAGGSGVTIANRISNVISLLGIGV